MLQQPGLAGLNYWLLANTWDRGEGSVVVSRLTGTSQTIPTKQEVGSKTQKIHGLECRPWTVDCGLWTVDCGLWTVNCGQWTVDCGF